MEREVRQVLGDTDFWRVFPLVVNWFRVVWPILLHIDSMYRGCVCDGVGITCVLSKHLSKYIAANMPGFVDTFLDKLGIQRSDLDFWFAFARFLPLNFFSVSLSLY